MFEFGGLLGLVWLGLCIWAIVEILGSGISSGKKALWILFVLVLPVVGFIGWLFAGPRRSPTTA
jgi:hypothetical protein